MFIRRITTVALVTMALLLCAAGSIVNGQGDLLREEFHQTYPLPAGGRVSLENLNGNVRVTAWDRDEVKVDAVKSAYRRERLEEVKIVVRADAGGVHIETVYPYQTQVFRNDNQRYENPATVEYTLSVPRSARISSIELTNGNLEIDGVKGDVKASSINGKVVARGLTGIAKLSTVNGNMDASFDRLGEGTSISLGSVNGSIILTIPSDSNAEVKAGSVHGGIKNDFGLPVRRGQYVGYDLAGQLGEGGPLIKLGNVNGGITIRHAQDGRPVSRATNLLAEKLKNKDKDDDDDDPDENYGPRVVRVRPEAARAARDAAREVVRAETELRRAQVEVARAQVEERRIRQQAQTDAMRTRVEAQSAARAETARAAAEARRALQVEASRIRAEARRAARADRDVNRADFDAGSTLRLVERESKTFSVTGRPNVNLQTFDGSITVRGWDKPEVQMTVSKRAATEQQMRGISVRADQGGSTVTVIADFDSSVSGKPGSVTPTLAVANLDVYVPRNSTLRLSSGDGRLELEGVNGTLHLVTGDGRIEVRDSGGQLVARTGDGRIDVANFAGSAEVRTGDGRITLGGSFAQLVASTRESPIVLTLPEGLNATIETDAELIDNEGFTLTEEPGSTKRLKRWKIGRGGAILNLRTGDGRVILRRSEQ